MGLVRIPFPFLLVIVSSSVRKLPPLFPPWTGWTWVPGQAGIARVLVSSGCYTRIPQTTWLKKQTFLLTVLDTGDQGAGVVRVHFRTAVLKWQREP